MRQSGVDAFEQWAGEAARPLFRTAWLLCGDWHRAEDLVQETFARMYRHWGRAIDEPTAYARTVLVRAFLSQRRLRSAGEHPMADVPERRVADGDPELRRTLIAALATLPPKDRAVLVLRYLADRSVEDVARDLDSSQGAVRIQAMRALAKLREAVGEDLLDLINP
jgi:RNA polymerase sigma-70 factor (sigma-E family)